MDLGNELRVIEVDERDLQPVEIESPEPERQTPHPVEAETKEA